MNDIYWITRLDGIRSLSTTLTFIIVMVGIILVAFYGMAKTEDEKPPYSIKLPISCFLVSFVFIVSNVFIPTTKEAYMIYGLGKIIKYAKSSEKVQELPDKAVLCLDKLLDEYLEDDKDKKDK